MEGKEEKAGVRRCRGKVGRRHQSEEGGAGAARVKGRPAGALEREGEEDWRWGAEARGTAKEEGRERVLAPGSGADGAERRWQ